MPTTLPRDALTSDAARTELLTAVDPSGQHAIPPALDAVADAVRSAAALGTHPLLWAATAVAMQENIAVFEAPGVLTVFPKQAGAWQWDDAAAASSSAPARRSAGAVPVLPPYYECGVALHELLFDEATLVLVVKGAGVRYTRPLVEARPSGAQLMREAEEQAVVVRRTLLQAREREPPPRRSTRSVATKP